MIIVNSISGCIFSFWSDKLGANQNNRTKGVFGARNKDYVGGATC